MIIAHPGHELRVFKTMQLYQPRIYILTDGSGYDQQSRVPSTLKILGQTACHASPFMGVFSDANFYQIMLNQDLEKLKELIEQIAIDLIRHDINFIFGDAIEGFNPSHDLCRYLINAIVHIIQHKSKLHLKNYDFLLEGSPLACPPELENICLKVQLDNDELSQKIKAAMNYPEIAKDVKHLLELHKLDTFKTECLRPVQNLRQLKNWEGDRPFYETYGREKVASGHYDQAITFYDHMHPLGDALVDFAHSH
jgi:hypothetical protein